MAKKKTIEMELLFPDGQTVLYNVPVIRMKWYSIEEIFQKDLLMLLPFYIIRYEEIKQQLEEEESLREELFQEYRMIEEYLEKKFLKNEKEKEFRDIWELTSRIVNYIFSESEKIKKGMEEIMGGQVLELESDKLIKKTEERMGMLCKKLVQDGRQEEISRIIDDSDYRAKLFEEYDI